MGKTPKQFIIEWFQLRKISPFPVFEKMTGTGRKKHVVRMTLPFNIGGRKIFYPDRCFSSIKEAEHNLSIILMIWITNNYLSEDITPKKLVQDMESILSFNKQTTPNLPKKKKII